MALSSRVLKTSKDGVSLSVPELHHALSEDFFRNVQLELLTLHIAAIAPCKTICNYHKVSVISVFPLQIVAGYY